MEITKPILHLKGDLYENFHRFKDELNLYFTNTNIIKKSNDCQVAKLKNLLGAQALEVYDNSRTINNEQETVEGILKVLETYCSRNTNELTNLFRFFTRKQQLDESFENYYTDLQYIIKSCHFENQEEKLLRLQLVIGIQNETARGRILKEDMSLNNIVKYCNSTELNNKSVPKLKKTKIDDNISKNQNYSAFLKLDRISVNLGKDETCKYSKNNDRTKTKVNQNKNPKRKYRRKPKIREEIVDSPIDKGGMPALGENHDLRLLDHDYLCSMLDPYEKYFECDSCEKKFQFRSHLIRHARSHKTANYNTCQTCMKKFKDVAAHNCVGKQIIKKTKKSGGKKPERVEIAVDPEFATLSLLK